MVVTKKVPKTYVPNSLSKKDKDLQRKELKRSRDAYKKGKYISRKPIKSFKSKTSGHILNAQKIYGVEKVIPSPKLAKESGCSKEGLEKVVQKGIGAYYSSGSRPSQTGHSWGYARMASAITGGKASAVDYHILRDHCNKNSKALKLAHKTMKKMGKNYGQQRVKRTTLGGYFNLKKKSSSVKKRKSKSNNKKMNIPQKINGKINFPDYPEFTPNLTPSEIFQRGSFGGTYWRPIYSNVTKKNYKDVHKQYPEEWWEGLTEDDLTTPFNKYDKKKNRHKVKVGTTLEFWEMKNWIKEQNPYGWVHWYCDFYIGKRTPDDERQIKRWKALPRFIGPLVKKIVKRNTTYDDESVLPRTRQTLQHWAYVLTKEDFDKYSNPEKEI